DRSGHKFPDHTRSSRPALGQHLQFQRRPFLLEAAEAVTLPRDRVFRSASPIYSHSTRSTSSRLGAGKPSIWISPWDPWPTSRQSYADGKALLVVGLHSGHHGHRVVF